MATQLPPPPIGADPTSWAQSDWYSKLVVYLTSTGAVPWALVDKAGANITDIPIRAHNSLQSLQGGTGGEYYHLTAAQYAAYVNPYTFVSQAADPTTAQIPAGRYAMYKNTTNNLLKLWANDGGTLKSVTLT